MLLMFVRRLSKARKQIVFENIKKLSTQFSFDGEVQDEKPHVPVMVEEVIESLQLKEGDMFLDMTFGAGGHSSALLERTPGLKVFALDRDPIAMEYASALQEKYKDQITPVLGKFSDLPLSFAKLGVKKNSIDGVLFDLGCSSMQLDTPERGFSLRRDGPLDMRMDSTRIPKQLTAADIIAFASQNELYTIFKKYGEEKHASKLATELVEMRQTFKTIKTTFELCDLVSTVCGNQERRDKLNRPIHPATKIFQALRIFVNNELNELDYGLHVIHKYLKPRKRVVVITFHSLEDRIVKQHFSSDDKRNSAEVFNIKNPNIKIIVEGEEVKLCKDRWIKVYKKPLVPSEEEVNSNPRSRSAKLRAAVAVKEEEEDIYHFDANSFSN